MPESGTPLAELLMHPVRWRIIQRLMGHEMTTAQLRAELSDVSTTTLYRHVAALVDGDVLRVVREERVRGAVERTLALHQVEQHRIASVDEGARMAPADHRVGLSLVLAQIADDFERAIERGDLPERQDELSYGQTAIYLTPEELPRLEAELQRVLAPYLEKKEAPHVRRLMLSVIAIPDAEARLPEDD